MVLKGVTNSAVHGFSPTDKGRVESGLDINPSFVLKLDDLRQARRHQVCLFDDFRAAFPPLSPFGPMVLVQATRLSSSCASITCNNRDFTGEVSSLKKCSPGP